jgi:hypothetical protein
MLGLLLGLLVSSGAVPSSPCTPIPRVETLFAVSGTRWIVAGELHGTNEMPEAFGDLVCAAARGKRGIIVALEHPVDEQRLLDDYLSSNGDAAAKDHLLSFPIWHWAMQDGRTSQAYLALLERLRLMKKQGMIRGVVAVQPSGKPLSPADYEAEMARTIQDANTSADELVVVLIGSTHARTTAFTTRDGTTYMPMAGLLPKDETITLDMSGMGGSAWNCTMPKDANGTSGIACAAHPVAPPRKAYPRGIALVRDDDAAFSGYFNLGTSLTASLPAATNDQ